MGRLKDLYGMKFGKLTVIKRMGSNKYKKALWLCKCDCDGNEKVYIGTELISGHTKSCGCYAKERSSASNKKYNTYDLSGEYGIGYTSKGEEFYFDLEDYDKIKDYCWSKDNNGYIKSRKNGSSIYLHRIIMNINNEDIKIDHIYHQPQDNRKSKLRLCNTSQNACNMIKPSDNTSGCKGVRWHTRDCVWEAYITLNQKQIFLGYFNEFEDAVKARKDAEIKYHKEFRLKNKIKGR